VYKRQHYNKIIKAYPFLSIKNKSNKKLLNIYESSLFFTKSKTLNNGNYKLFENKEINGIDVEYGIHFWKEKILCYTSFQRNIYTSLLKEKHNGLLPEYSEISQRRYNLRCRLFNTELEEQNLNDKEVSRLNTYVRKKFIAYVGLDVKEELTYYTDFTDSKHTQIFYQKKKKKNGKIVSKKCDFCKNHIDYAMTSISSDGKVMYFVSNDTSGYGGWDIYKTIKNKKNHWEEPVNLGKEINTEFDEIFPFVDDNEKLYFSSNGHIGFGGFDIYSCDTVKGSLIAKNLLHPVNTVGNDFSFIFSSSQKRAFCLRKIDNIDDVPELIRSFIFNRDSIKSEIRDSINVDTTLIIKDSAVLEKEIVLDTLSNLPSKKGVCDLDKIDFLFDKYKLKPESKLLIKRYFSGIKDVGGQHILLSGFCDYIGNEPYNSWLAYKRIESVAAFLMKNCGVAVNNIRGISYGEYGKNLVQSRNRKVVIELKDKNKFNNRILMVYKLKEERTVVSVAEQFLSNEEKLCSINSITRGSKLVKGSFIFIPIKGLHKVVKGSTVFSIAKQYKTSLNRIMKINNISSDYKISIHDILIIN